MGGELSIEVWQRKKRAAAGGNQVCLGIQTVCLVLCDIGLGRSCPRWGDMRTNDERSRLWVCVNFAKRGGLGEAARLSDVNDIWQFSGYVYSYLYLYVFPLTFDGIHFPKFNIKLIEYTADNLIQISV